MAPSAPGSLPTSLRMYARSSTLVICACFTSTRPRIWPIHLNPPGSLRILSSNCATLVSLRSTCSVHSFESDLASSKMHHARVSAAGPRRIHPAAGSPCSASRNGCAGAAHSSSESGSM